MSVYIVVTVRGTNLTSIVIVSQKSIANWDKFSSVIETEHGFSSPAFLCDLITLDCFP